MTQRGGFGAHGKADVGWPMAVHRLMASATFACRETLTLELIDGDVLVISFHEFWHGTFDELLADYLPGVDRRWLAENLDLGDAQ